jgi:alpha-1,3-glucosyltransferase
MPFVLHSPFYPSRQYPICYTDIHFQYNILLQTLFILSVYCVQQGRFLPGALFYATLINFKHIYIYAAPAFFIYLLRKQVCQASRPITNLFILAAVTLLPFLLSFGPFLWVGGVEGVGQILSRLFPFQRGLVHEYWAPNFWALYCGADKILAVVVPRIFPNQVMGRAGLKILPDISPIITILIILVLLIPLMVVAWRKNTSFPLLVVVCGLVFFTFGFHVHEKAITPYLNLLFLFAPDVGYLQPTMWLNFINLVPLLIKPAEKLLSFLMSLLSLWMWKLSTPALKLSPLDRTAVIIGLFIIVYHLFIHPLIAY